MNRLLIIKYYFWGFAMNVKRILLIGLILVAVVASLSIVSANSSTNVGGFDFNIPDGFTESKEYEKIDVNYTYTADNETISFNESVKIFEKDEDAIAISVMEFDSPDDAKKIQNADKNYLNGTVKTINGHEGVSTKYEGAYGFIYCKDNYKISVGITDKSLLETVVPK